ncbi:MAG: tetrathionate reductase family octaheme c-type cytochrome [Ignavibacteriales bacterium]|nr:tetrathionate reductase family octaheme c-type cytochrome [Ignavibacteriales bacterium]MCF8306192.1 tetrathionate reductase family octaheme c-type cytochrome [Ignavibacteriales bacterium]MCF8315913.1 tetrathionate reductase family octaheme c-type cytochrome [Ignavibacteriales bacterium]MCF8437507.1 tetrathionate reductase family octaheme c-type cytochrome [Ignavibacteriales bacterium]
MKKIILMLSVLGLLIVFAYGTLSQREADPTILMKLKEEYSKKYTPPVDHSRFAILQQEFNSPQEVTKTCVTCHNTTPQQVMNGNHWNWEREEFVEGRGIIYLGKKNAINNFCIGTTGNEQSCAKCHIGYGMDSTERIYSDSANIDCLICHDNTETYAKAPEEAGNPVRTLDLNYIAANVGRTQRSNCGVCHFYGGGGNNVKHGDLESAMFEPTSDLDVHMGTDRANLQCSACHTTMLHNIAGKLYSLSSMNISRATCEECHTSTPHEDDILNEHTIKVACQSCHIPEYAKENATKMHWDWSTAGKLKNGEPFHEEDSSGNHTYLSIKGSFKWEKNVKPDYVWFNGTASHYLQGDIVKDPSQVTVLNQLHGSYADYDSKIIPVKIHVAKQPYDPVNRILIKPKLYSERKGDGAFWVDFDWQAAATVGMRDAGLPFSGKIEFVETAMYWPVNHQVAKKEKSVNCVECHTTENSRLAGLTDFYLPGRDRSEIVDTTGAVLMMLTLLGIMVHTSIRIAVNVKRKKRGK